MAETDIEQLKTAILDPAFSHSRAGNGCWRDVRWIYHSDSNSPSGVKLASAGPSSIVEPLLASLRRAGPLSPTERY